MSLSRSIDEGLTNSRFGIVVLSKAFFEKDWTEEELSALMTRDVSEHLILPIWHDVTHEDVRGYSARLADKIALQTSTSSVEEIAYKLLEVINPEQYRIVKTRDIETAELASRNDSGASIPGARAETKLVVAKFEGPYRSDFSLDSVIIDSVRTVLTPFSGIRVETTELSIKFESKPTYEQVASANAMGASILLLGRYNVSEANVDLEMLLYIANLPLQPGKIYTGRFIEPFSSFRRANIQLTLANSIASLTLLVAAKASVAAQDFKTAIELLSGALNIAPENARFATDEIYRFRGLARFMANDLPGSEADSSESLSRNPTMDAYVNRSNARLRMGDGRGALEDAGAAVKVAPKSHITLLTRANVLSELGRDKEAIADYSRALQIDPHSAPTFYNRGNSHFSLGKYSKAINDYDKAIAIDPRMAVAFSRRAFAFDARGEYEKALIDHERAIEIDGANFAFYLDAAKTRIHAGDTDSAIDYCNRALARNPSHIDIYRTRGLAFVQAREWENAIQDFTEVLKRGGNAASDYTNRALAYQNTGDLESALRDLRAAYDLALAAGDQENTTRIGGAIRELDGPDAPDAPRLEAT